MTDMTIEEWFSTYKPIRNDLVPEASWNGTMYETYGDEIDRVRSYADKNLVWTWIDGDYGTYLVSGMSFVNRIGYFIATVPYEELMEDYSNYICVTAESWDDCPDCSGDDIDTEAEERCATCDGIGTINHEWND